MTRSDHTQIEDLLARYERALNASSAEAASSLYHADGVFMPMGLPSSRGSDQIHAAYAGIFGAIQLHIAFDIEEIEVVGGDAIAVTSSAGTVKVREAGLESPEANRELFVLRKQGERWTIYRYMFNKTSGPAT